MALKYKIMLFFLLLLVFCGSAEAAKKSVDKNVKCIFTLEQLSDNDIFVFCGEKKMYVKKDDNNIYRLKINPVPNSTQAEILIGPTEKIVDHSRKVRLVGKLVVNCSVPEKGHTI